MPRRYGGDYVFFLSVFITTARSPFGDMFLNFPDSRVLAIGSGFALTLVFRLL